VGGFDREQWNAEKAERRRVRTRERAPELRRVAQAVPEMEALTTDRRWDQYAKVVQGMIEKDSNDLEGLEAASRDSTDMSHVDMLRQKFAIKMLTTRINTMRELLEIPAGLIEQGQKALERLHEVESD
jgi:hypothetical protein